MDVDLPPVADHAIQNVRRDHASIVGDGGNRHQHLDGADRHALAEGICAEVNRIPVNIARGFEAARRFPGQVNAGGTAEAKALHVVIEIVLSHRGGDPCQADVERVLQASDHIL